MVRLDLLVFSLLREKKWSPEKKAAADPKTSPFEMKRARLWLSPKTSPFEMKRARLWLRKAL